MVDKDDASGTSGAQSVRRALAVLRVLASGQEHGARLTDVVSHTGLEGPTVHRLLRVLIEEGAVEQDPATRRYMIGGEVALLGLARSARFPIRAIAEPHLRYLSETLGDTTFLTIRNGADSVCIDRRPGSFPFKVLSIEVGARRPLGVGISGLVLLASLPQAEAAEIVRRNERKLLAMHVDPQELVKRTELTRALGYAHVAKGVVPGSCGIAVPVRLADGLTVAGLAMATITQRLPQERVMVVVAQLQERAALIGAQVTELAQRRQ